MSVNRSRPLFGGNVVDPKFAVNGVRLGGVKHRANGGSHKHQTEEEINLRVASALLVVVRAARAADKGTTACLLVLKLCG